MAARRLPMRRIRELLRLKGEAGLSNRAIAQACAVGLVQVSTRRAATPAAIRWGKEIAIFCDDYSER